jgi:tripartite ATP-independent transporter DctM subunit
MSLGLSTGIIIAFLFILLGSGLYIGLGLAAVGIFGFELLSNLGQTTGAVLFNSLYSFPLSAIPMFLFMGQIVLRSGLSSRLYRGVAQWTRIIPGGLLHSNIASCSIFAAVSGSSPATAATIGTVAIPEQEKRGYNITMMTGSLAAGGTLGILIPPSINMIVYGAFVGASVGRLFAGGVIPGIILAIMFMIWIALATVRNKSLAPPPERIKAPRYFSDAIRAFKDVWPMITIIVLIMGSIYGGIMTPTEAAAASAFLALILAGVFRKLNYTVVRDSALNTLKVSAMVFLLFIGANLLGNGLSMLRIPTRIFEMISHLGLSNMQVWLGVVILYIIMGCLMDTLAMMLITLPVTYPLMVSLCGFDPIWFGVQLVILCEIGMVTPPVGINLFVIHGIAPQAKMRQIIVGILPFFVCMLLGLALYTFVPDLILFLPNSMLGR